MTANKEVVNRSYMYVNWSDNRTVVVAFKVLKAEAEKLSVHLRYKWNVCASRPIVY